MMKALVIQLLSQFLLGVMEIDSGQRRKSDLRWKVVLVHRISGSLKHQIEKMDPNKQTNPGYSGGQGIKITRAILEQE